MTQPQKTSPPQKPLERPYDLLIVGEGLPGCLVAAHVLKQHPHWLIAMVGEDSKWAGRHSAPLPEAAEQNSKNHNPWGYGLHGLSQELTAEIQEMFTGKDSSSKPHFEITKLKELGYLQGGSLHRFTLENLGSAPTIGLFEGKKIATVLAQELSQWTGSLSFSKDELQELLSKKTAMKEQIHSWSQKHPTLFEHLAHASEGGYFHHLARLLGVIVEDFLDSQAPLLTMVQRYQQLKQGSHYAAWDQLISKWLAEQTHSLHLFPQTTITAKTQQEEGVFKLATTHGMICAHRWVGSHHCWKVSETLDLSLAPLSWQKAITHRSLTTEPTSLICLIASSTADLSDLPQITSLARERIHALRSGNTLIFQGLLPYENTLHAPRSSVMVRRLRRGLKQLAAHTNRDLKEHFLTVLPYAYPALHSAWKEKEPTLQRPSSVFFCEGSYGPYLSEEKNLQQGLKRLLTQLSDT